MSLDDSDLADGDSVTIVQDFRREDVLTGLWFTRVYVEGSAPPDQWDFCGEVPYMRVDSFVMEPACYVGYLNGDPGWI